MSFVLYKLIRIRVSHHKTGPVSLLCIAIEDVCWWSLDVVARRALCMLESRHQMFLDWEGSRAVTWVWIQPVLRVNTFVFPIVALTAHGCGTVRCYCTKVDSLCTLISRGSLTAQASKVTGTISGGGALWHQYGAVNGRCVENGFQDFPRTG